jgi:hypothetical protein
MKLYGYYSLENTSHDRGYGEFEADSLQSGFEFLWKEVTEIVKNPEKISQCYVYLSEPDNKNESGFGRKTAYGWSKLKDNLFAKNLYQSKLNSLYIWAEKPTNNH